MLPILHISSDGQEHTSGEQLTQLMIEYNVGVAVEETYTVKKIDLDYFEEA
jgi:restriction endonuclease Mrr